MTIPVLKKFNYTTLAAYGITDAVDTSSGQSIGGQKIFTAAAMKLGTGTGLEVFYINGGAGSTRALFIQSASVNRWGFGADSSAESGSNAGSAFVLTAYDDDGAALGNAFSVNRATRVLDFSVAPTVAGSAIVVDSIADADTTHAPSRNAVFDALAGKQATIADSGWIAPTLLNGWVNFGGGFTNAGYRKVGSRVFIRGSLKDGTTTSLTAVLALPAGYRPTADCVFVGWNVTSAYRVTVRATGSVEIASVTSSAFISIDGISFFVD
jgi:hypothetical protein